MATYGKKRQVEEIIKCGKDPIYFFNTYVKIQHPTRGLVPFDTFPFQDDCVQDFIDHKFNIILKSRQLGISTLSAAYAVWLSLFYKEQSILIIATKQKVAQNIIRKVKTILSNIPSWLYITKVVGNNKQEVEFSNGSIIKAVPTSDDAGRSEALSLLIIDEAAFIKNFDTLWTGLYSTLSTGGRAIILSTPNGVGGKYHELYSHAEAGLNDFNPIKLPWDVHPERDAEWLLKEKRNMSEKQLAQELMCDFLASGDTFLGGDDIKWVASMIKPPLQRMGPANNVWIWSLPLTEHKYVLSADVSRGDAVDFSTFTIIDTSVGEVAAEYKGKIRPDLFAELIDKVGRKYNNALACPENNTYGYAVCMKLKELDYPRMYYQNNKGAFIGDYIPPQDLSKAGFQTNGSSRGKILGKLEEVIRNKRLKIYSSRFLDELKTFIWHNDKAQSMRGKNDDLIISTAIASWLYDGSSDHSQSSNVLNQSMLAAMGKSNTEFSSPQPKGSRKTPWNPFVPIAPSEQDHVGSSDKTKREVKMANDLSWLLS
jgi:hypothetical protein